MVFIQKYKHALAIIALIAGSGASVAGLQAYDLHQHQLANEEYAAKLFSSVEFSDKYDNLECKDEKLDSTVLLNAELNSEIEATIYPQHIDLTKPGQKQVDFLLKYKDDLGTVHRDIRTKKIDVVDKTPPNIDLSSDSVEMWQYDSFNAADYIAAVKDGADGDLALADELGPGKYTVSSDVDTNTPGNYTVTVKASDMSGNEQEKSFAVAVYQMPAAQPAYNDAASNAYYSGYSGGYSGGYSDYGYSSYSAPSYASNGTNFDAYWGVTSYHDADAQSIVDSGGIAAIGVDYFHHNTSDFMNQFMNTQAGDTVTLNGTTYTCTGIGHGYSDGYSIYSDSGEDIYLNGSPHVITCDGSPGTDQRWIMYLEETGN